jgi:hypothetical protein
MKGRRKKRRWRKKERERVQCSGEFVLGLWYASWMVAEFGVGRATEF